MGQANTSGGRERGKEIDSRGVSTWGGQQVTGIRCSHGQRAHGEGASGGEECGQAQAWGGHSTQQGGNVAGSKCNVAGAMWQGEDKHRHGRKGRGAGRGKGAAVWPLIPALPDTVVGRQS